MKKLIALGLGLGIGIGLFGVGIANAATYDSAEDTANVSAAIITPISIASTVDLSFGQVVPSVAAGTVTMTSGGARSSGGGVYLGNTMGQAASFTVSGEGTSSFTITLPTTVTITNGAETMDVTNWESTPAETSTLVGGERVVTVGARLNVDAGQAAGNYTNTFSVTVAYN